MLVARGFIAPAAQPFVFAAVAIGVATVLYYGFERPMNNGLRKIGGFGSKPAPNLATAP